MTEPLPPAERDRLAGRYFQQCPVHHDHRTPGLDCPSGPVPARDRRHTEKNALRRYLDDLLGTQAPDPLIDPSDCRHGCNGACVESGSDRCDFTCHPSATA